MKTPLRVLALFSISVGLLCPPSISAAPVVAKSAITAVTVYADRAVVTRAATLDLAPGLTEVTFDRLPASLISQSLQVSGRGAARATILDVTTRLVFTDVASNDRVKALEAELRAFAKERRTLEDRVAALTSQQATLGSIESAATAAPAKDGAARLTMEEAGKLMAFLVENRAKLATVNQSIATQLEDLTAKSAASEQALNELKGLSGRSYQVVTVRLDAPTAGSFELAIGYALLGASWSPTYDARVDFDEKSIALAYQGVIRQSTGEDWNDIALTLSTARPALGGAAPGQKPWVLDILYPTFTGAATVSNAPSTGGVLARKPVRPNPGSTSIGPASIVEEALPAPQFEAFAATATLDQAATSASFKVATPATIPSDNSPQKVPITSAALTATFEYNTTPKLSAAAFLAANVVNGTDYPFLTGPLNVFLDGTFVASSTLRTVMPGEKFDLALGVDDGISVKHRRLKRFTEDTGLTSSGKRIIYEYLITLQNNKKAPVHLTVSDRLPVSRNERIVVKQLVPDAKELKPGAEGALKWTLDLKPGEKRDLTLKFTVDHPNDLQITGLEP